MRLIHYSNFFLFLSIALFSINSHASWMLDSTQSTISVVSIKKAKVAEVHQFKHFAGKVDNQGKAEILINLESLETQIPIRNERIQKFLFETKKYPYATVTGKIDLDAVKKMNVGDIKKLMVTFKLDLHGKKIQIKTELQFIALPKNQLLVSTVQPFILKLGNFDLIAGLQKLQEIAKLPSIDSAVPATVNLVFKKEPE